MLSGGDYTSVISYLSSCEVELSVSDWRIVFIRAQSQEKEYGGFWEV